MVSEPAAATPTNQAATGQPAARGAGDSKREMLILALVTFCSLVLFVDKPIHIDDPLFVWSAQQITQHPTDFYGFDVNWYGTDAPMHRVNQNPPLAAYVLAAVGAIFGFGEIALHLAFLLITVVMTWGVYLIAKEFCAQPFQAALVALFCPVTLISASSLMCDTLMLACWCWAVVFWLWSLRTDQVGWALAAGVCMALAFLSKYFGIALVPLLGVYAAVARPRSPWWKVALVIPIVAAVGYEYYTRQLYGHGMLLDAVRYASDRTVESLPRQMLQGLLYLGGCLLTTVLLAPLVWSRFTICVAGGVTMAIIALWLAQGGQATETADAPSVWYLFPIHASLFLLIAVQVLSVAAVDIVRRRDAGTLLLLLWIGGTLFFATFANWTVTARTLLPAAPPVAILFMRRIEERRGWRVETTANLKAILIAAAACSLFLTHGDVAAAKSVRRAAIGLFDKYGPQSSPLFFEGHWGFQYYMQIEGARAVNTFTDDIQTGQFVVMPLNNTNVAVLPEEAAKQIEAIAFIGSKFTNTNSSLLRAKFYAAMKRLSLPFVIGPNEPDIYLIQRAAQEINFRPKPSG